MIKAMESEDYKNPYIIVDTETGEVLDDAEQKKQYEQLTKKIKKWIKHHKGFTNLLDAYAMEIETKINTKLIKELIEIQGITDFPCTPREFIKFYFK